MIDAAYITLSAAAEALGVSESELAVRIRTGNVPEAVGVAEQWFIPHNALAAIAAREEMILDLTGSRPQNTGKDPAAPDLASAQTADVETHAAIVAARAQSVAARADAEQLRQELNLMKANADRWHQERNELLSDIAGLRHYLTELQQEHAEATRQLSELKTELDHERVTRAELVATLQALENERT